MESEMGLNSLTLIVHLCFMQDWLFAVTQIVAFFVIQNELVLLVTKEKCF